MRLRGLLLCWAYEHCAFDVRILKEKIYGSDLQLIAYVNDKASFFECFPGNSKVDRAVPVSEDNALPAASSAGQRAVADACLNHECDCRSTTLTLDQDAQHASVPVKRKVSGNPWRKIATLDTVSGSLRQSSRKVSMWHRCGVRQAHPLITTIFLLLTVTAGVLVWHVLYLPPL